MNMEHKRTGSGHPVLGLILGILAIVIALLLCLMTGVIGAAIAGVLAVLGLVLGIMARKSGRGIAAIIICAVALFLTATMTLTSISMMDIIKQEAVKAGTAPLVVQYANKPYLGLMGFFMSASSDGADLEEFDRQLSSIMNQ